MSKLISIVKAVDALKRIPHELRYVTFFSKEDVWVYHFVSDDRICERCRTYGMQEYFAGNELRKEFPDLVIQSTEVLYASVHPNCRCYLTRLFPYEEKPTPEVE